MNIIYSKLFLVPAAVFGLALVLPYTAAASDGWHDISWDNKISHQRHQQVNFRCPKKQIAKIKHSPCDTDKRVNYRKGEHGKSSALVSVRQSQSVSGKFVKVEMTQRARIFINGQLVEDEQELAVWHGHDAEQEQALSFVF